VADEVSKIILADKTNVIDVIVVADKAIVTIEVIEAIVIDRAKSANEAEKANVAKANKLLADIGIATVLQSLTKYCEVFTNNEGYFEMMISNN
jgi:hypothetical protein